MGRLTAGLLAALVLVAASSCADAGNSPSLSFGEDVPDDVAMLADATWEQFLAAVPARQECLTDLRLETSRSLAVRGSYESDIRVLRLRIPHTAPRLERTLVHEFAHHLEFSCPAHQALRSRFLAAQGHPAGADWFDGSHASGRAGERWAAIPSEQWAEAVTKLVLGDRTADPTVHIDPRTSELVRAWVLGESLIGR